MLAPVQFQVLGPLRVENEGEPYELGGPKQRAVLALLVASAGRPVSTESLIMDVYGEDADPKVRRSLQTYISSLRSEFGNVIHHENQAYTLNIDPASIDAVRFERAIHRARATTDDSVSSDILENALGMWRGTPYRDIDASISLQSEIARLEGLHAEALEARIELDLIAGRHRELLVELTDLTSTYPMREGLRGLQMLAMYRCGRQAEALRAYQQTQAFLRTELGLDPSPELQALEARILEQDPDLDYRPKPRLRPAPARYTRFFGRSRDIDTVRGLLLEHRIVTITGTGGIGKSSLAAEVTTTLIESMATAFVPVDAHPHESIETLILNSLGVTVVGRSGSLEAIAEVLSLQPTVLLLDGCERIIDEIPLVLSEILSRSPSTKVLVTSREGLFTPGEHRFLLGPLDQGEGSSSSWLFENRAGISGRELDASSREMVSEIVERLSGIPLALELAAARHRTVPLAEIVKQLDRQPGLLTARRGSRERHLSMNAALDWSYDLLDPVSQTSFRRLSVFRQGFHPDAAASVLEMDDPTDQLHTLADASLLVPPDADGGFRMLEPVRQFARMHLERSGELDETLLGYAGWILGRCEIIDSEFHTGNSAEALTMLRMYGPEIEATARWVLDSGRPALTMALVDGVWQPWRLLFDPRGLRDSCLAAIEHPDAPGGDALLRSLAHAAWLSMETDRDTAMELVDRLTSMYQGSSDPGTLYTVMAAMAIVPRDQNSPDRTETEMVGLLAMWDRAMEYATVLGWPAERYLYTRAVLLEDLGRIDEADAALRQVLLWAGESRPLERGMALHALARSRTLQGSFDEAIAMATEAARLLVDGGDLNFAAEAQYKRAHALYLSDRSDEAMRALAIVDEYHKLIGLPPSSHEDPALVAAITGDLGDWDGFVSLMETWIGQAPSTENGTRGDLFLIGEPAFPSQVGLLMYPTARWLVSVGRRRDAARIVAGAPMAFDATAFDGWEDIGEPDRIAHLGSELDGVPAGDPLSTLDEMYTYIVNCFR